MKSLFLLLLIPFFSYSQLNDELKKESDNESEKMDNEMILSTINFLCSSLNETGKSTFNCYEKNNDICCDVDLYTGTKYYPDLANELDKVLISYAKDIIYNRIVISMKKTKVFEFIEQLNSKYSIMHFKFRFSTTDGTVLKYKYYINLKEIKDILDYLNKDDFFELLHKEPND